MMVTPNTMTQPTPLPDPPSPAEKPPPTVADMFAMPMVLPDGRLGGGFDAAAYDNAKIDLADRNAFRDHVRTCGKLPAEVSPADKVRIVLRVAFNSDGSLAGSPTLIEASASAKGPLLMMSAMAALRACQPYTMLPPEKYAEWKVIDLSFTPQDFGG
jgi:hypothetical protein